MAKAAAVQEERYSVPVSDNFDPARHSEKIIQKLTDQLGPGWKLGNIHTDEKTGERKVMAYRRLSLTRVVDKDRRTKTVDLGDNVRSTDAEKCAVQFARDYPGFHMTSWDFHLAKAKLTMMSDDEVRCRGAIAVALSCKPWDIPKVQSRPDGGYDIELPRSYMPSKHDVKLEEVATSVVGREGWYVKINAMKLTAEIIPSDPPTFPEAIPYPMRSLGKGGQDHTTFGMQLPHAGDQVGEPISIDWTASAFALIGGTPGSGKTVSLSAIIASALAEGCEIAIIDDEAKSLDFIWCKDFCRPGGWGCDSLEHSVATLGLVYNIRDERKAKLGRMGLVNWLDMPANERFTPILVIVDEVSALLVPDPVPKGIPKDHPLVVEVTRKNLARAMLASYINKTLAELRFVGVRMILSTQATNANTGVPPSMRTKIGNFILQGTAPSKAARGQIFTDESAIPTVPNNVQAGGKRARGVGVAQLEGQTPAVYKSFFATTGDYRDALLKLGVKPTRGSVTPTAAQIDQFLPRMDDEDEEPKTPARGRGTGNGGGGPSEEWRPPGADAFLAANPEFGAQVSYGADGKRLQGAAAAASAGKRISDQAARAD